MDKAKMKALFDQMMDTTAKLNEETARLAAETAQINRSAKWYPLIAAALFLCGVVLLVKLAG